jgi:hypothetical protein
MELDLWKLTRAFYERRKFAPAWIEGRLSAKLAERLARMKTSAVAAVTATTPPAASGREATR